MGRIYNVEAWWLNVSAPAAQQFGFESRTPQLMTNSVSQSFGGLPHGMAQYSGLWRAAGIQNVQKKIGKNSKPTAVVAKTVMDRKMGISICLKEFHGSAMTPKSGISHHVITPSS